MNIINILLRFIFWAPRAVQETTTSTERGFILFSKILVSSTGVTIGGLSLIFILLGNEEWVRLGAYGLIVYTILGLTVLVFYNQRYGEYLP